MLASISSQTSRFYYQLSLYENKEASAARRGGGDTGAAALRAGT